MPDGHRGAAAQRRARGGWARSPGAPRPPRRARASRALTCGASPSARDAVARETPAAAATSASVGRRREPASAMQANHTALDKRFHAADYPAASLKSISARDVRRHVAGIVGRCGRCTVAERADARSPPDARGGEGPIRRRCIASVVARVGSRATRSIGAAAGRGVRRHRVRRQQRRFVGRRRQGRAGHGRPDHQDGDQPVLREDEAGRAEGGRPEQRQAGHARRARPTSTTRARSRRWRT